MFDFAKRKKLQYPRLIISLILPQLAGLIGSVFMSPNATPNWYAGLARPGFTPPGWVFGPAWLLLYLLMGISVYLIWQKIDKDKEAKGAVIFFFVHLVFNAAWTPIFFGFHNIGLALANIVVILVFIIFLMMKFWGISRLASCLLIPYFLWVSFATVLNYYFWILN